LGQGCNHQLARHNIELTARALVPHSSSELPHQLEMVAETEGSRAMSNQLDRNGWRLEMGHGVPSDLPGDDGAINLLVAQFDREIGEDRIGTLNDGVGRAQVTRLKSVDKDTERHRSSSRPTSRCFCSMRATVSLPSARRLGGWLSAASCTSTCASRCGSPGC